MTRDRFTQIYCCLCAFAFAGAFLSSVLDISLSQELGLIILVLAVTLLGLPHGALDFSLAKSLKLIDSQISASLFVFVYMLIAVLSIGAWVLFPALGLSVFIIISVYHFGADWREETPSYVQLSLATIVLCGPSVIYSSIVTQLFTALLLQMQMAQALVMVMQISFTISAILFSGYLLGVLTSKQKIKPWVLLEYGTLIASSLVLPPLVHFVLYFCALHSPKHMQKAMYSLQFSVKQAFLASIPFVALSIFIAFGFYHWFGSDNLNNDILRWVFVGLFGLTMSHMLLVSIWHRSRNLRMAN